MPESFDFNAALKDRKNQSPGGESGMPDFVKALDQMRPSVIDRQESVSSTDFPPPGRLGMSNDLDKMASASTSAAASLPTDRMTAVKYIAKQIYPNKQWEDVAERFFFQDGRLAYHDIDGKAYYAEAEARAPTSINNVRETGRAAAGLTGPAIPVVTGTAAGLLTLPYGGGIPGAATAGAVGDIIRQGLAHSITGEEKPWSDRFMQTGGAALQEGTGQVLGHITTKGAGALFGRTPRYDVQSQQELREGSRRTGIPLTAAEETGDRTLIRRQKILANTSGADEIMENFYRSRNVSVEDAVRSQLDEIAPPKSVRSASASGVSGAKAAQDTARRAAYQEAKPYYDEALKRENTVAFDPSLRMQGAMFHGIQGWSPLSTINRTRSLGRDARDYLRTTVGEIRKHKLDGLGLQGYSDNAMRVLDAVKKRWDAQINTAVKNGDKAREAQLTMYQTDLLKLMDDQFPAYKKARSIYDEAQPLRTDLERGVVGDVARLEANDTQRASRILFNPRTSSPEDVAVARQAYNKAGKGAEWADVTRAYLESAFSEIPESSVGAVVNLGGTYRKALFGSQKKAAILREALADNPQALESMEWLMTTLDATGKAMKGESITAFAQAGQKELAAEARGLGPAIIETVELWRTPSRVAQYWADAQTGKYADKMARLFTDPDGVRKLKELMGLSPTSKGAVIGLSHLLLGGGIEGIPNSPPSDIPSYTSGDMNAPAE